MILTKEEILKEIKKGNIKITPFKKKNLGPASIDLTLDNKFRIFTNQNKRILVNDKADYRKHTKLIIVKNKIILRPGECALGITKERVKLPTNICGWLQGRSRFARLGLMVHITASLMQPGIDNQQVLELFNASQSELELKPGTKICQFAFERCEGNAKYHGRYSRQKKP